MPGHTTTPPQEQRLLDLHGRLWGLATELLLPSETASTDEGASADQPHRPSPPRPPRAIIEDIKRCRTEADAIWAERREDAAGEGSSGGGTERGAEEARAKEAARRQREQLVVRLRARYLGQTTEAFADELDALRTSDGTFKGTEEDVRGLVAILEEGVEALLAEGDEGVLGVYHDHLLGGDGDADEEKGQSADVLDEPVHARVRREKGMMLSASSARASSRDADNRMDETSKGGSDDSEED